MLTARQQEIWQFLAEYVAEHGYPPTVREIGEAVGLASPSTVHAHLAKLESSGVLRRDPSKPRAIEILVERTKRVMRPSIPLVGQVAAGAPILAEENIEDQLEIPPWGEIVGALRKQLDERTLAVLAEAESAESGIAMYYI